MDTSAYTFRTGTEEDWPAISELLAGAFNEDEWDSESAEAERVVFEPGRTVVTVDRDDALVGHASSFTRDLTVPGAVVPAAHVTMVGVSPLHRRRGLLTTMIARLHADALALGEPIAVLWASEGRIYQRYGYGLAAQSVTVEAEARELTVREVVGAPATGGGTLRRVPIDTFDEFRKVYEQVVADRPGWTGRNDAWWQFATSDPKARRNGATALQALVHDGPDGTDGYMLWRVKGEWDHAGPKGAVVVREMVATSPAAYRAFIEFALRVDLTRTVKFWDISVDAPLPYIVDEPRRLNRRIQESLWVRVLDVPRALAARRYAAPVDVVIEVADPDYPANAGRFRLVGHRDSAACTPTDAPADIWLEVGALGAAYLGSSSLSALAEAGRVREVRPGTLVPAALAFGWHRAASGSGVF